MVCNVVVPAGRGAVGIQLHIAAVEPPQQRCVATQHQAVDDTERAVVLHAKHDMIDTCSTLLPYLSVHIITSNIA